MAGKIKNINHTITTYKTEEDALRETPGGYNSEYRTAFAKLGNWKLYKTSATHLHSTRYIQQEWDPNLNINEDKEQKNLHITKN